MRRLVAGAVIVAAAVVLLPLAAVMTAAGALSRLPAGLSADIPAEALVDYQAAAAACPGLEWTILAGIGKVESDHGRSQEPGVHRGANPAGAEGPMQFLPATFAAYAVGPHPSPYDMADATVAAARLLCANGAATPAGLRDAIWDYNHSWAYVDKVLGWAARYGARSSAAGAAAAAWAIKQVGLPYQWGAAGPDAFDCSGLVMRAWEAAGVELPRVAADQYQAGTHERLRDAVVGDLLFYAPDISDPATIEHVALYLGDGMMVEAPHPGATVRIVAVYPEGLVPNVTRP
ncbi:MAG: C40 family peptidase [Acidimicrobiales bacterium]